MHGWPDTDIDWMRQALRLADQAASLGEVPVGAVVVRQGEIVGRGHNRPVADHDPSAHAEIVALREAGQTCGNYRLGDCDLFVTLEPCAMCFGAMAHARIRRVVFGSYDDKSGAVGSALDLSVEPGLNHRIEVTGGLLADDSEVLLKAFFEQRRD